MLKLLQLQVTACNFLVATIKPARKWAAPSPSCLLVGPSSGKTVHPGLAASSVRQAADDHWRTGEYWAVTPRALSDWTVRCGWLQVASCNIVLVRAARPVQVSQDFF